MRKTEIEKVREKRALFIQGAYCLSVDSLTGEIINPDFQAIDRDLFREVNTELRELRAIEQAEENHLINQVMTGEKICLNDVRGF